MNRNDTHTLTCECGYENMAHDKETADRYARRHEGREGHIGMVTVEPADANTERSE